MSSLLFRLLPAAALSGVLAAFATASGAARAATAAEPATLPPWVVPVLRLVSSTHVQPTTGVVLSDSGLVLVPLEFGLVGDEIVVLDGGTDIVRNGRPARLEHSFAELGVKVLRAEGLRRRAAPLAAKPPADGDPVTLAAFPPAERIEEGAPPVREHATVRRYDGSAGPGFAPDAALPNLTGALLDACGNLVGVSIADGVQSMSASGGTRYRWSDALARIRAALGLPEETVPCMPASETAVADAAAGDLPEPPPPATEETPEEQPAAETAVEPAESESALEVLPPAENDLPEPIVTVSDQHPESAEEEAGAAWWWLVTALALLAAGFALHRWRRRAARTSPAQGDAIQADAPPPDATETTPPEDESADCRLALRGQYADGRPLSASVPVNSRAVNVEIGRGGTDLALDSPAVSRRHARLNGRSGALTLTDLGSSNGSSINGVPCLEGEMMYVEPGDSVILGDVRFTVALEAAESEA